MCAPWLPYWIYPIYMFVYVYINISGPVVTYAHILALYKGRACLLSRPGKVWYKTCLGLGMGGWVSPWEGTLGRSFHLCASVGSPIKVGWLTTVPGLLHAGLLNMSTRAVPSTAADRGFHALRQRCEGRPLELCDLTACFYP